MLTLHLLFIFLYSVKNHLIFKMYDKHIIILRRYLNITQSFINVGSVYNFIYNIYKYKKC